MLATSRNFEESARKGLADGNLQRALALMGSGFPQRRRLAVDRLPEFEALREVAKSIKDHTLENLDFYLELYEENVVAAGAGCIGRGRRKRPAARSLRFVDQSTPGLSPKASR